MIPAPRHHRGTTLVEILMVVTIMGTILTAGVPRLGRAFEGGRADLAAGTLRGLWNAERMYWLEHRFYTADIDELIGHKFIDADVKSASDPFTYSLLLADEESFSCQAVRNGSGLWSGALSLDESGVITGQIEDGNGGIVTPYQD
ncbi:MAG: prepilin-type cleavage/methylation domain-containing protein [Planctomycetota bacterium]|nr:MAG: prepilin-type cleavage/methylation domain-containing protein [Planctomycetota bacterium]